MSKQKLPAETVEENRRFFLSELRSGKYPKGTIRSDERGRPIVKSDADEGWCACALMVDLFYEMGGVEHEHSFRRALNLTAQQCRFIQQDINDTPDGFDVIADRIECEVFNQPPTQSAA
jgi:hypothetical protein